MQNQLNSPASDKTPAIRLLAVAENFAQSEMRDFGSITPAAFFLTKRGVFVHRETFNDATEKDAFVTTCRFLAVAHNAMAVATVAESWFASPAQSVNNQSQSADPCERRELVHILSESREGASLRLLFIRRDAAGDFSGFEEDPLLESILKLPSPNVVSVGGMFSGLVPSRPPSKLARAMAKRALAARGLLLAREPAWGCN